MSIDKILHSLPDADGQPESQSNSIETILSQKSGEELLSQLIDEFRNTTLSLSKDLQTQVDSANPVARVTRVFLVEFIDTFEQLWLRDPTLNLFSIAKASIRHLEHLIRQRQHNTLIKEFPQSDSSVAIQKVIVPPNVDVSDQRMTRAEFHAEVSRLVVSQVKFEMGDQAYLLDNFDSKVSRQLYYFASELAKFVARFEKKLKRRISRKWHGAKERFELEEGKKLGLEATSHDVAKTAIKPEPDPHVEDPLSLLKRPAASPETERPSWLREFDALDSLKAVTEAWVRHLEAQDAAMRQKIHNTSVERRNPDKQIRDA